MANNQGNNQSGNAGSTSNRGFASMDPDKQRAIAAQGGRAAHASGNAHQFTPAEASAAGRKGGTASHSNRAAKLGSSANSTRGIEQQEKSGGMSYKEK